MADGLKRDQIVILRIDGEDLLEFLESPCFESDLVSIFSEIECSNGSYSENIIKALEKLTVDQGMPPAYDSWVRSNIIDVALQSCASSILEQPVTKETFLIHFKKVGETIAKLLKEQPVIVAHSENTLDGSGIKKLLSNKFELDKILSSALQSVPRDPNGKISNEYLRAVLDFIAPSAGFGAVHQVGANSTPYILQMDRVTNEAFKVVNADEVKIVEEEELKKLLLEVLGNMMLQLDGNLITVNTNSVVHEPLAASSDMISEEGEEN